VELFASNVEVVITDGIAAWRTAHTSGTEANKKGKELCPVDHKEKSAVSLLRPMISVLRLLRQPEEKSAVSAAR